MPGDRGYLVLHFPEFSFRVGRQAPSTFLCESPGPDTAGRFTVLCRSGFQPDLCRSHASGCNLMDSPAPSPGPHHVAVLPAEVLDALAPAPGQTFVDATVGAGGHARLLAERLSPGGRLIGLDRDAAMLDLARPRLAGLPVTLVQANFERLRDVLDELGIPAVDG